MQHKLPPAEKDTVNSGQILEIIFNSFNHRHGLTIFILNHRILFQRLRKNSDLRQPAQSFYTRFLSVKNFSGDSRNFQLRVKSRKESGHQILEAVKNRQSAYQCQCSQSHSADGNG